MIGVRWRKQIEIVGWRYERYSTECDTWDTITTLSLTAPEIREQAARIRRLTPLVAFDDIVTHRNERRTDTEATTERPLHTTEDIARQKRALAAVRTGREVEQEIDSNRND